jgi:hypothetical protein
MGRIKSSGISDADNPVCESIARSGNLLSAAARSEGRRPLKLADKIV